MATQLKKTALIAATTSYLAPIAEHKKAAITAARAIGKADTSHMPALVDALRAAAKACSDATETDGRREWKLIRRDVIAAYIQHKVGGFKAGQDIQTLGAYEKGSNSDDKRTKEQDDAYNSGKMWFSRLLSANDIPSPHGNGKSRKDNAKRTAEKRRANAEKAAKQQAADTEKAAIGLVTGRALPATKLVPVCGTTDAAMEQALYLLAQMDQHCRKNAKKLPGSIVNAFNDAQAAMRAAIDAYAKETASE